MYIVVIVSILLLTILSNKTFKISIYILYMLISKLVKYITRKLTKYIYKWYPPFIDYLYDNNACYDLYITAHSKSYNDL